MLTLCYRIVLIENLFGYFSLHIIFDLLNAKNTY